MNTRSLLRFMIGLNLVLFVTVAALLLRPETPLLPQSPPSLSVLSSAPAAGHPATPESRVQPFVTTNADPLSTQQADYGVPSSPALIAPPSRRKSSDSLPTSRFDNSSRPVPEQAAVASSLQWAEASGQPGNSYSSPSGGSASVFVSGGGSGSASRSGSLPAALVPNDPAIPITTDQQVAEWEKLQDDFLADVGGPNQNLSNPRNLSAWELAQRKSDELFKAKFGWQAFLAQNAEAGRQLRNR